MTQLNQIVAVEKGVKNTSDGLVNTLYKRIQHVPNFNGFTKTYSPKDDEGDRLPDEGNKVQLTAKQAVTELSDALTRLFDIVATKEYGNREAIADVIVDGNAILKNVPITLLLFLEKKLVDIRTFVSHIPVLDPSQDWSWDASQGFYRSGVAETIKTKKFPKVIVKWEPRSPEFTQPAQTDLFTEDVVIGTWSQVKFSGALSPEQAKIYLERVDKLLSAVKFAREKANSITVTNQKIGNDVFGYIFR